MFGGRDEPWGDGENDAKGLTDDHGADVGVGGRGDDAVEATETAGDVEHEITGHAEVEVGPLLGAARLVNHELAELVVPPLEDLGGLEEDVPALFGERLLPCLEGLGGRVDGGLDLGVGGAPAAVDDLAGGRGCDVEALGGVDLVAVDEEGHRVELGGGSVLSHGGGMSGGVTAGVGRKEGWRGDDGGRSKDGTRDGD